MLEYCCDIILSNAYFAAQFERLQKHAVRSYLHNFSISYERALIQCDLPSLSSRRCASAVVNILKYHLCSHYVLSGFVALGTEIDTRRSSRGDRGRDLVLCRNYFTDLQHTRFITHSPSFKKSFFYRAVYNYNIIRRSIDMDSYSFKGLRCVL